MSPVPPFFQIKTQKRSSGAASVVALMSLVIILMVAAGVLRVVIPRYHVSHQTAGWQEARLAAEAGIDLAIERLNTNVTLIDTTTGDWKDTQWSGWKMIEGTAIIDAKGETLSLDKSKANTALIAANNVLKASDPIYLDNVDVSPTIGTAADANVEMRALYPSPLPRQQNPWFRIRSMGTAGVPGPRRAASDRMDSSLRRLSLKGPDMRPSLQASDVLTKSTVPFPNASRIVEVLARPVMSFDKAIRTDSDMILGNSNNWVVNSFDSGDPNKSDNGLFPGNNSSKIQKNGDIASNKAFASSTMYGALIEANGAKILGNVSTHGGDNPATIDAYENVSGAGGLDPSKKIDAEYDDPLTAITVPTPKLWLSAPTDYGDANALVATKEGNWYRIPPGQKLPAFKVKAATGTGIERITIYAEGGWDIGNGNKALVEIPPNVKATIYVKGNIDFGNGMVNMTSASSKMAPNLFIYGVPTLDGNNKPIASELNAAGNTEVAAAFYGPSFKATVSGTVEWIGAVAAYSYKINGGGNGGFHYDESLGGVGFIRKWVISSYFEDSRQ